MKILILGGDGYLGWPTAMHFSANGHDVAVADNFVKRRIEMEQGIRPLMPVPLLQQRIKTWHEQTGKAIRLYVLDMVNPREVYTMLESFRPDAIVHYAEQPSAPYSMLSRKAAFFTQSNNVLGNLNLLFAMQRFCPKAHLIKLGTMGEYGTPNIDIEEGYITITHNGRTDTMPYPKKPGSFYHLSKVHDSNNIMFACNVWGLSCTDLNQGVVYGIDTDETEICSGLQTSFHYDSIFGTVLNRFLVQAATGSPLTVYGKGGQTRGFLHIRDTLQCVNLVANNPPAAGEFRVMNQFTEQFSVLDLAKKVQAAGKRAGIDVEVGRVENPRKELEEHYYNAKNTRLIDLGLKPHLLTEDLLDTMWVKARKFSGDVDRGAFKPNVFWAINETHGKE